MSVVWFLIPFYVASLYGREKKENIKLSYIYSKCPHLSGHYKEFVKIQ